MKKLKLVAKCSNCKHCHYTQLDTYYCSKGLWTDKYYNQNICKHWKPSLTDMKLWIERGEEIYDE